MSTASEPKEESQLQRWDLNCKWDFLRDGHPTLTNPIMVQQEDGNWTPWRVAQGEVDRLRDELREQHEAAEEALACRIKTQEKRENALLKSLEEAVTLLHLMWHELDNHFNYRASSLCLSEIAERIEKITGKRPSP